MREIKFRAWDKEKKSFKYFELREALFQIGFEYGIPENIPCGEEIAEMVYQEFTGIRDKNGKEIYDGDVLALDNPIGDHRQTVVAALEEYEGDGYAEFGYWWYSFVPDKIEVIGNIYENPTLLKEAPKI